MRVLSIGSPLPSTFHPSPAKFGLGGQPSSQSGALRLLKTGPSLSKFRLANAGLRRALAAVTGCSLFYCAYIGGAALLRRHWTVLLWLSTSPSRRTYVLFSMLSFKMALRNCLSTLSRARRVQMRGPAQSERRLFKPPNDQW